MHLKSGPILTRTQETSIVLSTKLRTIDNYKPIPGLSAGKIFLPLRYHLCIQTTYICQSIKSSLNISTRINSSYLSNIWCTQYLSDIAILIGMECGITIFITTITSCRRCIHIPNDNKDRNICKQTSKPSLLRGLYEYFSTTFMQGNSLIGITGTNFTCRKVPVCISHQLYDKLCSEVSEVVEDLKTQGLLAID